MTFTPTEFKNRCDCGRLFVVSQEFIDDQPESLPAKEAAALAVHCLHCIDGQPHAEELALDIRTIGGPEMHDHAGVQITLPSWEYWVALVEGINIGLDDPYSPKSTALRNEFLNAAYEHGI